MAYVRMSYRPIRLARASVVGYYLCIDFVEVV